MRAEGRPSGSTVASVIACALRISAKASFSQLSRSGSGSAGRSVGSAGLGMSSLLPEDYLISWARRPPPIHQGGDDVDDVGRVDRLAEVHVEAGGARLADAEPLGKECDPRSRFASQCRFASSRQSVAPAREYRP